MRKLYLVITLALALGLLVGLITGVTVSAALRQTQDTAYPGRKIQIPSINVQNGWSTWITAAPVETVATRYVYLSLVAKDHSPSPTVSNLHMSDAPYGPPVTEFPSGTTVVYMVFDYFYMQNDEITLKVLDSRGDLLFEQTQAYSGSDTESIQVSGPGGGAFADGWYRTRLYLYSAVFPTEDIRWDVGDSVIY
jgi:hypothetical protein